MKRLSFGALAISLAISAPAMAQTAPSAAPAAQPQPGAPASAPAVDARSAASDASATVTVGMPVKDNTGVAIGTVSSVQPGPNGAPTATITMGTKVFSVGTDTLAVSGGAATVNASKTQIEGMLPK